MYFFEKIGKNSRICHQYFKNDFNNPKSYISYLLLKEYYKELDISFKEENDWRYYFIVRRHFLRKRKKINGGFWICHYCGSIITTMQKRNTNKNNKNAITVDHKNAISKGGDLLSTSNMVECCTKCNRNKDTKEYELFILENSI